MCPPKHIISLKYNFYSKNENGSLSNYNKIKFGHKLTIVPMVPFTPKPTSKLRSALHFRYLIVIQRYIPCANTAQF